MESFGLWYLSNEKGNEDEKPKFSFHANFWSEDIQTKGNKVKYPYLDIGIRIENWNCCSQIVFHCPFVVKEEDLTDLTDITAKKETAELVFNDYCQSIDSGSYKIITVGEKERKYLLFPLVKRAGQKNKSANIEIEQSEPSDSSDSESDLIIDLKSFKEIMENTSSPVRPKDFKEEDSIYLRFRIASDELKDKIYFDSNPYNKSLESAFTSTRIVDFKVNEERNLSSYTRQKIAEKKLSLAEFDAVHFLIMVPSSYDVQFFPDNHLSCRELESGKWNEYYGNEIDTDKEHVLAYHTRMKDSDNNEKPVKSFSSLIKIKAFKSNRKTVGIYLLIVIALGMISSSVVNMHGSELWYNLLMLGFGILILIAAFIIRPGRR